MNDTGWTFVPTAEELERIARLPDLYDLDREAELCDPLRPARGIILACLLCLSLSAMAIGLLIAAVRGW